MIVGGLYAVLWGKDREIKQMKGNEEIGSEKDGKEDLELQLHPQPQARGNHQAGAA